jgi:predicted  nucleic acid-binding Zn-ribbon protein
MILKSIREIKEINNIIMSIRNLFNDPVILKNLEKMNLTREAMKNAVENTKNTIAALDQTGILYESKEILASKKRINLHENAQNLGKISNVTIGLAKSFRELINELKFKL